MPTSDRRPLAYRAPAIPKCHIPGHVTESFDRLSVIVYTARDDELSVLLDQLEALGKIDGKQRRYIELAHQAIRHGIDDEQFRLYLRQVDAATASADTQRERQFLNWLGAMLQGAWNPHHIGL